MTTVNLLREQTSTNSVGEAFEPRRRVHRQGWKASATLLRAIVAAGEGGAGPRFPPPFSYRRRCGAATISPNPPPPPIRINENEPLLLRDMARTLAQLAPAGAYYEHNDFGRRTVNMNERSEEHTSE